MKNQHREFQKLDKISSEEMYCHRKSGYAMKNQHREFQKMDKFGSEEIYRRIMEGL
jgi:hypothetical protein